MTNGEFNEGDNIEKDYREEGMHITMNFKLALNTYT